MSKSRRYGGEDTINFKETYDNIKNSLKVLTDLPNDLPTINALVLFKKNSQKNIMNEHIKKITIPTYTTDCRIVPANKINIIPLYDNTANKFIEKIEAIITSTPEKEKMIKLLKSERQLFTLLEFSEDKRKLLNDLITYLQQSIPNNATINELHTHANRYLYDSLQNSNESYKYLFNAKKVNDQINIINEYIIKYNNGNMFTPDDNSLRDAFGQRNVEPEFD